MNEERTTEDVLARFTLLAAVMPVVAGQGGNAGAQTATIAVRSIALATLLGVIIPLGLKWRGIDPALAANIFVTGTTDILSFLLFLGLAAIVIERIV